MATDDDGPVGRGLRTLCHLGAVGDLADGQLLARFVAERGEAAELAFAALVERHGPMVLRVARGVLLDPDDAQDAFQATFLVLVAKAGGLRTRDSLGPWLHQVARRTALCQRATAARRRRLDRRVARGDEAAWPEPGDDLAWVIHEEICRLPERLRGPVVLCDLEGRTHEQAARDLGWPVGTVKSRQARARDRLRVQLARRGVAPTLGWPALRPILGQTVPSALVAETTAAASRFLLPRAIGPGPAATLARKVIQPMTFLQPWQAAAVFLSLGAASGVGLIAQQPGRPEPAASPPAEAPQVAAGGIEVKPGKFAFTINERGVVEPGSIHPVVNEVPGNSVIAHIVPEGTQVKEGDLVAEIDPAPTRDQIANQAVIERQAEARYKQAVLTREVAEFAVKEYEERVFAQDLAEAQGSIRRAEANIEKGRARLDRTRAAGKRLDEARGRRSGPETAGDIVTELTVADNLDAAEADIQARTEELAAAQGRARVLKEVTRPQQVRNLQADVERAKQAELTLRAAWSLEQVRAAKLERQMKGCRLTAPADGVVVWGNEPRRSGGRQPLQIEDGATVRERQILCTVIDLTQPMRVNASVHESLVDKVQPGQTVRVRVEALPDQVFTGVVRSVAPSPDPARFGDDGQKIYPTIVQLDQTNPLLRTGMNAAAAIQIFDRDGLLAVPVGMVATVAGKDRIAVATPGGTIEWREVTLGATNLREIEVTEGLKAGERVLPAPQPANQAAPMKRAGRTLAAP